MKITLPFDVLLAIYHRVPPCARPMFIEGVVTPATVDDWRRVCPETLRMLRDPAGYVPTDRPLTLGVLRARMGLKHTRLFGLFKHTRLPTKCVKKWLSRSDAHAYAIIRTQPALDLAVHGPTLTDDNWMLLCRYVRPFSMAELHRWKHRIHWKYFSKHQRVTESIAETFQFSIDWHELGRRSDLRLSRRFWQKWGYKIGRQ